jgi:hypothetical protein
MGWSKNVKFADVILEHKYTYISIYILKYIKY